MLTRISQHRFTVLLVALLLLMLTAPAVQVLRERGHGDWAGALITLLTGLVLLAAVPAVSRTRGTIVIAVVLVGPAIVLRALDVVRQNDAVEAAHLVSGLLFFAFAIVLIIRHLIEAQDVTLNTISASLCAYMAMPRVPRNRTPRISTMGSAGRSRRAFPAGRWRPVVPVSGP